MKNIWLIGTITVINLMLGASSLAKAEETYNILSVDGGGIRGIIPA